MSSDDVFVSWVGTGHVTTALLGVNQVLALSEWEFPVNLSYWPSPHILEGPHDFSPFRGAAFPTSQLPPTLTNNNQLQNAPFLTKTYIY